MNGHALFYLCNKEELFHEWTIHQAIILMQLLWCVYEKLGWCRPAHLFLSAVLVLFHLHRPLMISLRDVAPPTTCLICVAALKAWQTPPLSDSLQQTYLTSSVSRTQLMEMDQQRIESSKRRTMSNNDLICEFPACVCFTSDQKSFTIVTFIIVFFRNIFRRVFVLP